MFKKYYIVGGLFLLVLVSWLAFGSDAEENNAIMISPKQGNFNVDITTTGELRAKNSTSIRGPERLREIRINEVTIQKLIPEGTVVQKGDFVADLDRTEINNTLQDAELDLQGVESQYEQARLDSSLTLSQARDNLVNLEYALEENQIAVEQSKYESPAVQRQAQIDFEKAKRALAQAKKNYKTQVKQSEAKIREIEVNLQQERNEVQKIKNTMKEFTIYAPENGMVIYKRDWRSGTKLSEGGSINRWDPVVAELPDFSVMESVTYVNEVDIQKVKGNQPVDISLDAMPDKHLEGTVTSVANIGEQRPNSDSKVFEVIIEVSKSDTTLRPAMTTSNVIHINSVDSALYVPLETVHAEDSLNFVFKKNGLETVMQQVELGMMNESDIVINEGLTPDDQLYMSIPEDTTGVRKVYLSDEIVAKYRSRDQASKKVQAQEEEKKPAEMERKFHRRRSSNNDTGSRPSGKNGK